MSKTIPITSFIGTLKNGEPNDSNYPPDQDQEEECNKNESMGISGDNKVYTKFDGDLGKFGLAVTGTKGYKQTTIDSPTKPYVPDMDFSKSK